MATNQVIGSNLGTNLSSLLTAADIEPGSTPGYQLCKVIFTYHPIGQKMAEAPIKLAQYLPREISIGEGPEDDLREAFVKQQIQDDTEKTICNTATLARVYGISSLSLIQKDVDPAKPLDVKNLWDSPISFNVLDPLNTAGSLVLNQDPNAFDFQKKQDIAVNGKRYHRSRTVTIMNESPIYIEYTTSAFGFVGRSVYQRSLYPLKSFISTMVADDMVARKVGLIVAMLKMAGSVVDRVMEYAANIKRTILKLGATDNVLSISTEEEIKSLDLTNIGDTLSIARKHILENIAAGDDMPAIMLNSETFADGFGEGTEDAKKVAAYVEGKRRWIQELYTFMDMVTQYRAWNPDFYKIIQAKYPEYKKMPYEQAFFQWTNSFKATWPSLIQEPDSEKVRVAEIKLKSTIATVQVILPEVDPDNFVKMLTWFEDQLNNTKMLFTTPLSLDYDILLKYRTEMKDKQEENDDVALEAAKGGLQEPGPDKPFSAKDSVAGYLAAPNNPPAEFANRLHNIENFVRKLAK